MRDLRVLITDRIAAEAVERFKAAGLAVAEAPGLSGEALLRDVALVHALVVRSQTRVDARVLEAAGALLVVGRAGVGYENIDVEACSRLGVAVVNTPGASAITTAERTIALLLTLLHQVAAADRSVRAGRWERRSFLVNEATAKTLGVLGYGNVGRVVADRALGLKMRVRVHDPAVPADRLQNVGLVAASFDEVFTQSDVVTCHVSADPALKGLIGRREFALMRSGTWFVNTARGFLIDEDALVDALRSGRLKGAALDVFADEPLPEGSALRSFDNVVLSPHLGASSAEAEQRVSIAIADDVVGFLRDGRAANLVARPSTFRHAPARAASGGA